MDDSSLPGSWRQEDQEFKAILEFQASLGYTERPYFKITVGNPALGSQNPADH